VRARQQRPERPLLTRERAQAHTELGSRWASVAKRLPGRCARAARTARPTRSEADRLERCPVRRASLLSTAAPPSCRGRCGGTAGAPAEREPALRPARRTDNMIKNRWNSTLKRRAKETAGQPAKRVHRAPAPVRPASAARPAVKRELAAPQPEQSAPSVASWVRAPRASCFPACWAAWGNEAGRAALLSSRELRPRRWSRCCRHQTGAFKFG